MKVSHFLVLAILTVGCASPAPEQDPVVQRMTEMDGRLLRIERILSNQSLLEQAQRVDSLAGELRALRGQLEQLQHAQESAKTQQRDYYNDLSERIKALESRGAAQVSTPATANTAAAA